MSNRICCQMGNAPLGREESFLVGDITTLQEQRTITILLTFCLTHEGTCYRLLSLAMIHGEQNKPLALYLCLWERNEERRSPIGQMSVRFPQMLLGGLQIPLRYIHVRQGATPILCYCGVGAMAAGMESDIWVKVSKVSEVGEISGPIKMPHGQA